VLDYGPIAACLELSKHPRVAIAARGCSYLMGRPSHTGCLASFASDGKSEAVEANRLCGLKWPR